MTALPNLVLVPWNESDVTHDPFVRDIQAVILTFLSHASRERQSKNPHTYRVGVAVVSESKVSPET